MKRTLSLLLACTLSAAELPVRQVVLYKHGVGYFSRSGELGAGESARLDFAPAEMNDVLKSLTVVEQGGGKVTALRYDSSIPLAQKLSDLPFQVEKNKPLSEILDQFKGARVVVSWASTSVTGTIVSGRVVPGGPEKPQAEKLVLMLDSGDLQTVELADVVSVRFTDAALQQQFRDYLQAVQGSRSRERRSVYIDSSDKKARRIDLSYVIPVPAWKSSYRLIFDKAPQPTLEGWAIVDNTTSEDWTNVRLSLVSGRPISFISPLYQPRYIQRPIAGLPEDQPAGPVIHQGAVGAAAAGTRAEAFAKQRRDLALTDEMRAAAPAPPSVRAEMAAEADAIMVAPSAVDAAAGRELGDLFEYALPAAVTVKKNESAMMPFIQQKVTARKLLIYTGTGVNPTNAAELTNSTGNTLDGGPITVFDEGAYGGEALMETTKTGDKRLISYAVDLGTRITTLFDSSSDQVREIHARRGILTIKNAIVETKTYTIRNVDAKAKTLIIEHPARPEYRLISPKAMETTPTAYRFELALAPSSEQKFVITEEHVLENTLSLINLTPDVLLSYVQNQTLPAAARKQLERVADLKTQIAGFDRQIAQADGDAARLAKDAERLRQNMESLNRVSGQQQQVQAYAKQLADLEVQIAAARDRRANAETRKQALMTELNSVISAMQF